MADPDKGLHLGYSNAHEVDTDPDSGLHADLGCKVVAVNGHVGLAPRTFEDAGRRLRAESLRHCGNMLAGQWGNMGAIFEASAGSCRVCRA